MVLKQPEHSSLYKTKNTISYKVKILILGSANSGKSLLSSKYTFGFTHSSKYSIGVDISVKNFTLPNGEKITDTCWTFAPQERFQNYWFNFFRGALGAIILFDITDLESFKEVKLWVLSVRKYINCIPIILMGNKVDLNDKRVITYEEAEKFAEKEKFAAYIETSVKENVNIIETLELLNEIIYYRLKSGKETFNPSDLDKSLKIKINNLKLNL
jgi:Ras-related protein Rab-11A